MLLLSSSLEGMNDILSPQRREKGSKTKPLAPCSKVAKLYNSGMRGVSTYGIACCHISSGSKVIC